MGRLRSLITQSPAIVISILAVALSLGGGAYASTHHGSAGNYPPVRVSTAPAASHSVATTGVTWTSLSLINGWASENSTFAERQPEGGPAERHRLPFRLAPPAHSGQLAVRHPAIVVPPGAQHVDHRLHGLGHHGDALHRSRRDDGSLRPGQLRRGNTAQCFTSLASGFLPNQLLVT